MDVNKISDFIKEGAKSLKIYKQSNYKNWDDVVYLIKNDLKNKFSIS